MIHLPKGLHPHTKAISLGSSTRKVRLKFASARKKDGTDSGIMVPQSESLCSWEPIFTGLKTSFHLPHN
jgi:hypothetical protein